jgi:hypothetical protein
MVSRLETDSMNTADSTSAVCLARECCHASYLECAGKSEAATALWLNLKSVISESKAVSRYACHRTPKDPVATARGLYH